MKIPHYKMREMNGGMQRTPVFKKVEKNGENGQINSEIKFQLNMSRKMQKRLLEIKKLEQTNISDSEFRKAIRFLCKYNSEDS